MPYFDERPTLAEKVARIQSDVEAARERRDREKPLWEDTYNYYRSDPPTAYDPSGMRLQVNLPFAYYESMRPSLVFENPVFSAEALSPESEESRKTVEAAVNAELRSIKFKRKVESQAFDGIHYGVGILQLGYHSGGLIPGRPGGGEEQGTKNSDLPYGIKPGQIYVLHIRPQDFLIDPNATCLDDAMWCGVEYTRDLKAVKEDPQYRNTSNLEANASECPEGMTHADFRSKFGRDPEMTKVRICQYWDIIERKVFVVAEGHEKDLGTYDFTLPVKRFPFYAFRATDDNETFYCQSPMVPWLNLVEEYNLAISNRLDHLSRFKRKYAYDKSRVSEEEAENLIHPVDGTLVGVDGGGQPVRGAVEPIADANVSTDSYAFTAEVVQRWTQISGMSEFDLGGSRPGERPAAEINRISGAANGRRSAIAGRLRSVLGDFADDARAVMEKYYTKEKVVRLTGDRGETVWAKYDGSGLAGEYLWDCRIEDMGAKTRDQRVQEAAQALQVLTPYSQAGSPAPIIDIRPQLREVAKVLNIDDLRFLPEQGPMMDPGRELFLMLKKGLDLQPNEMDDHEWHIFVHEQQMGDPEVLRSPSTLERLENHLEYHRAMVRAMQQSQQGMQQVQQQRAGGGAPGPAPGSTNNPSGGAGVFSTGQGNTPQQASGGASGQNINELMRGGFGAGA